mmetsp:Transcript_38491/g.85923  ORF Transcript_38491/g.85923 Transcript_38491/m.85923 type:complete len:92 (+) Transcript_38491:63-338(+)
MQRQKQKTNGTQEAKAPAVAQQAEAQPAPSVNPEKIRESSRPPRFPAAGLSKEGAGWTHREEQARGGEAPPRKKKLKCLSMQRRAQNFLGK